LPRPPKISYPNVLQDGDKIDFKIFFSSDEPGSNPELIWEQYGLTYDFAPENHRELEVSIPLTTYLQTNGTASLNAEFILHTSRFQNPILYSAKKKLTKYVTFAKETTVNLMSGEPVVKSDEDDKKAMHFIPEIEIHAVHDVNIYSDFPPQIADVIQIYQNTHYYPIILLSDFWVLKEKLIPLNSTLSEVKLKLTYDSYWVYKYFMMKQFELSQTIGSTYGLQSEHEYDLMKRMFLETNPYFLGLTLIVSFVHMIFEFMAFKSEIEFWKGRQNLKGLSTNMLLYNFVSSIIILLYLLDTGETSWAVWLPMTVGIVIELWKLTKGFDISIKNTFPFLSVKGKEAHKEGGTDLLDNVATKYLSYILMPLILIFSIYSLYAYEYKSWYSWFIGTLATFIYTAGFIMMTPQLYINYKLQSVAHMPWKVLTYKALNTFIDDMFAFIIAMPIMHRLACFRDDIIFVVYLYQKWSYRVDPNRHYLDDLPEKDKTD